MMLYSSSSASFNDCKTLAPAVVPILLETGATFRGEFQGQKGSPVGGTDGMEEV